MPNHTRPHLIDIYESICCFYGFYLHTENPFHTATHSWDTVFHRILEWLVEIILGHNSTKRILTDMRFAMGDKNKKMPFQTIFRKIKIHNFWNKLQYTILLDSFCPNMDKNKCSPKITIIQLDAKNQLLRKMLNWHTDKRQTHNSDLIASSIEPTPHTPTLPSKKILPIGETWMKYSYYGEKTL